MKLLLVDGNAILHRAYHAFPLTLTTRSGELVNATYGFTSALLTAFKKLQPSHVIVAFDSKGPTFRHEQFEGYKASRPKMDDELVSQLDRVKQVVTAFNIPQFAIPGFEADDLIGTLATQAKLRMGANQPTSANATVGNERMDANKNFQESDSRTFALNSQQFAKGTQEPLETVILTGDRDALQLVDPTTQVFFPSRGKFPEKLVGEVEFEAEWGFTPIQLIDFKALAGDASDEIPGVKGIGPKTATELIKAYGPLEQIYEHLSEIKETVRQKLVQDQETAFLSKQLATIKCDAPIALDLDQGRLTNYDKATLLQLMEELEFQSLMRRLPSDNWDFMVEETFVNQKPETGNWKQKPTKEAENQMSLF